MSEEKPTVACCYPEVDGVDLTINAALSAVSDFDQYAKSYVSMKHVDFITHPSGNVLEIRMPEEAQSRFGPIFINEKIIFSEFVLSLRGGVPFHCVDCADQFTLWFIEMQLVWGEKYHVEWYRAYCEGGSYAQRLH